MAVALIDDLFPSKRHPGLVQTEWASGWMNAASGFGYAAEYLTDRQADFGATIDQAGIAVFYLQRHRVELALKGLLDYVGADVTDKHGLVFLWGRCKAALAGRYPNAWAQFEADHFELIRALDRVDGTSYAFRYPVDTKGVEVVRPANIELSVLNEHVGKLDSGAGGFIDYIDHLAANQPTP